jgi:hypothetical protein
MEKDIGVKHSPKITKGRKQEGISKLHSGSHST